MDSLIPSSVEEQIPSDEIELPIFNGTAVDSINTEQAFQGLNLFDLTRTETNSLGVTIDRSLVITDMNGTILFEQPKLNTLCDFYNVTTVLCRNNDEEVTFWNFETGTVKSLNFRTHHDIAVNPNNNTLSIKRIGCT